MTLPIVDRIMACCVDWNGQPMHPREEPRSIPDCGDLQEAADAIEQLATALTAVRSYYFLANPTGLTEAQVCDLVCGVLDKIGAKVRP